MFVCLFVCLLITYTVGVRSFHAAVLTECDSEANIIYGKIKV